MTNTTNFNFTIPDGSDNVNLLTQNFPNWTNLDAILKAIKDTGVTTATATKTGTNFAVVRSDADCNFFRFIATANYVAGDTFTVDGVPVTATSAAGTALPSGAFVINQSVIAIVNSGVLTVLVGGGLSSVDASDVDYDNTGSGLTATDVQDAIDELKADMPIVPASYAASAITYDNTVSGLAAADVQDAIDELAAAIVKETPITGHIGTGAINPTTYYAIHDGITYPASGSSITVPSLYTMTYTGSQIWNATSDKLAIYSDTLGTTKILFAGLNTAITISNACDFTITFI